MSITLTTPFTLSGSQSEDDTVAAITNVEIDFIGGYLTVTAMKGTLSGNPSVFGAGVYASIPAYGQIVIVKLYIGPTTAQQTFGMWWLNGVQQAAIVPLSVISSTITQLMGLWNQGESFMCVSGGLLPGTQVPWTVTASGTLP